MRLIIAGGRHYKFTDDDIDYLNEIEHEARAMGDEITEVVSGGATGADAEGEKWARQAGLYVTRFPAEWKSLGKKAGPIRNRKMAEYGTAVALFPGGRGTTSMADLARAYKLKIFDRRHQE